MKTTLLTLIMLIGTTAFAHPGAKLVCKETSAAAGAPARTMVLTQRSGEDVHEGVNYIFDFELYAENSAEPLVSMPVVANEIDVMLKFASDDGRLSGIVFKDELDQTAIHFEGEDIGFDCAY